MSLSLPWLIAALIVYTAAVAVSVFAVTVNYPALVLSLRECLCRMLGCHPPIDFTERRRQQLHAALVASDRHLMRRP